MDWRIILALVLLLGILVGAMGWHAALKQPSCDESGCDDRIFHNVASEPFRIR